jgi:uncharacterized DUF497 family protein
MAMSDGFVWDERKRAINLRKHSVDFALVARFEFDTAVITTDNRKDYGEVRFRAFGQINGRLHVLIFTARGAVTRVISLRRANTREVQNHAEAQERRNHRR